MKQFANIGKAVLIRALGIQKNYKETVLEETQFTSHCDTCQAHKLGYHIACASCPYHSTTKKICYVNERNQFGYQPRLKANALKLLLYFHFEGPDANGIIQHSSIVSAAKALHCSRKTIRHNIGLLTKYGYLYTCSDALSKQHRTVMLVDYKNYSKKAQEGGRGYFVMTKEIFETICADSNLNAIRLQLRMLLDCDSQAHTSVTQEPTIRKTYHALGRYLPRYHTRKSIQEAIKHTKMFRIQFTEDDTVISLLDHFNAKQAKKQYLNICNTTIVQYVTNIVETLKLTDPIKRNIALKKLHISPDTYQSFQQFDFTEQDFQDLASICLNYSVDYVKDCIRLAFTHVLLPGKPYTTIGALVQHICQSHYGIASVS